MFLKRTKTPWQLHICLGSYFCSNSIPPFCIAHCSVCLTFSQLPRFLFPSLFLLPSLPPFLCLLSTLPTVLFLFFTTPSFSKSLLPASLTSYSPSLLSLVLEVGFASISVLDDSIVIYCDHDPISSSKLGLNQSRWSLSWQWLRKNKEESNTDV